MTPEAYRVYQHTTDLLSASPNKKVQQAARYDGVLFARMCQRLAEEWTRQGKKTTAEDVAKGLNIVPAGGVADGGLKQAMFDVKNIGINSVSGLVDKINERKRNGEPENKVKLTTDVGITFGEERVIHAQNEHNLTKEDLDDIQKNSIKLNNASLSNWKKGEYIGQYGGKAVLARVDGNRHTYVIVLEFTKNGTAWFNTAYTFKSKESANKKIEEENKGRKRTGKEQCVNDE